MNIFKRLCTGILCAVGTLMLTTCANAANSTKAGDAKLGATVAAASLDYD